MLRLQVLDQEHVGQNNVSTRSCQFNREREIRPSQLKHFHIFELRHPRNAMPP